MFARYMSDFMHGIFYMLVTALLITAMVNPELIGAWLGTMDQARYEWLDNDSESMLEP
jgi:hypothetical protein